MILGTSIHTVKWGRASLTKHIDFQKPITSLEAKSGHHSNAKG